ncbi:MAG TPA: FKBP-type peptidyl-prolyl cis-trans isomerase [Candidatus Saccharimonadales bacterium]|nr:FKBP-type peptidyl-prolyl cis-trans isomerase [Candidatus Saccharimonadales bacterium]
MARTKDRIFALIMVIVFIITTVGVGIGVAWQVVQDSREDSSTAKADTPEQVNDNKLAGTKMQDFTPIDKVTELQIIDVKEGTGAEVTKEDTVTVDYTGALAKDGTVFESSLDSGQKATFPLSGVIAGWTEGMPGMKVGGVRRLVIPAEKAYGAQSPSAAIPANSDLVFDITLHSIQGK